MLEVQALVCRTNFGFPKRQATGIDFNRINLLMAVLEKRIQMQIGDCDAYVNVAGGIKVQEPAIDLGIVMAIASSFKNRAVPEDVVVFGEIGLSGEVRAVNMAQVRVQEAKKLGFKTCIMPAVSVKTVGKTEGMEIIGVKTVNQAMQLM